MTARAWQRQVAGQSFVLLVVLLPALVAGLRIDLAAEAEEWRALARAVEAGSAGNPVGDAFLRATIPGTATLPPEGSAAAAALLATARLAQVGGIAAIAALGYLTMSLAGSRARALLAVGMLLLLPPVVQSGHVLRAETAASLFGLLALLLLQLLAVARRPAASRPGAASQVLLGLTAAVAVGLAAVAAPTGGILLLLPGAASVAAAGQVAVRLFRFLRGGRSVVRLPLRAATARLWPWVMASAAAVVAALVLLQAAAGAAGERSPTAADCGVLPAAAWLRYPLLGVAVLGALRLLLRTGQRLGRRGRLGPDLLLFLYCAILLLQRLSQHGGEDALLAVVPAALLLADGAIHAALLLFGRTPRS